MRVQDGHDVRELRKAINEAQSNAHEPTLIEVKPVIGYGSPNKSAKADSHGAPLGADEVKLTKEYYKWTHEDFHVPEEVYADFNDKIGKNGEEAESKWNELMEAYKATYPELAEE